MDFPALLPRLETGYQFEGNDLLIPGSDSFFRIPQDKAREETVSYVTQVPLQSRSRFDRLGRENPGNELILRFREGLHNIELSGLGTMERDHKKLTLKEAIDDSDLGNLVEMLNKYHALATVTEP